MSDKLRHELNWYLIDTVHRLTGYDKDVLVEYIESKDGKYSIYANLTLQTIHTNSPEYKKVLEDLHFLDRKMKIDKLIQKKSD